MDFYKKMKHSSIPIKSYFGFETFLKKDEDVDFIITKPDNNYLELNIKYCKKADLNINQINFPIHIPKELISIIQSYQTPFYIINIKIKLVLHCGCYYQCNSKSIERFKLLDVHHNFTLPYNLTEYYESIIRFHNNEYDKKSIYTICNENKLVDLLHKLNHFHLIIDSIKL